MKKGNAALLAVVLVAAVGAFMLVTKVGMTAQVVSEDRPTVATGPFCGVDCRNANDCAGNCGQCSEFTKTCIGTADFRRQSSLAERAQSDYTICNRGCDNAYGKCQSRNPSKPSPDCYPSFKACAAACGVDYAADMLTVR